MILYVAQLALLAGCGIFFFLCIKDYLSERKYSPPADRITVNRLRLASVCLSLSLLMTVGSFMDSSALTVWVMGFAVVPFIMVMRFFIRLFEYLEHRTDLFLVILSGVLALVVSVACLWIPVGVVGLILRLW